MWVLMEKKTVSDVIINRLLADVEKEGSMPWQRPYKMYNSFNYFTLNTYRGINRILLPFGEYMTAHQINEYNKKHGEDYRFQKGIEWYPVVFFKVDDKEVSRDIVEKKFPDVDLDNVDGYIGNENSFVYFKQGDIFFKRRKILKYTNVAERRYFKNSKGECLPSRLDTGEVEVILEEPERLIRNYISKEGIKVRETGGCPCYIPGLDMIEMNYTCKGSELYSTFFHEMAHSTGSVNRLCRDAVTRTTNNNKEEYAKEECLAEIVACLCCAECGIHDIKTSEIDSYKNSVAYVSYWKKKVKDWGKEFIFIVSEADKAFDRILSSLEEEL